MARNKRKIAMEMANQLSIFDMVQEINNMNKQEEPEPGSLNIGLRVKEALAAALKNNPCKRWEIAGRMSEYIGCEITESMLNAWTAESKDGYRFPLEYLPAFCRATESYEIIEMIARACNCQIVKSEEVALLELARIENAKRQLQQREKQVKFYLEKMNMSGG